MKSKWFETIERHPFANSVLEGSSPSQYITNGGVAEWFSSMFMIRM